MTVLTSTKVAHSFLHCARGLSQAPVLGKWKPENHNGSKAAPVIIERYNNNVSYRHRISGGTLQKFTTSLGVQSFFKGLFGGDEEKRADSSSDDSDGRSTSAPATIPQNISDRERKAIDAVNNAISSPRTPSFPLIECEFPPLESLNKMGDGSLRSAQLVESANLDFVRKVITSIKKRKVFLLISSSCSGSFLEKATNTVSGATVHRLRDGLPDLGTDDVCVLTMPSSKSDYDAAKKVATGGNTLILINGFAKDTKSVPGDATMAYYLKPLTYNSQIAGFLIREYPSGWTTIDSTTKEVLRIDDDGMILVRGTNTPDLRQSVRLVQKSFDQRAIEARKGR